MTIYTTIIGDYDALKEPLHVMPGVEYVCYTDQPLRSDIWQIRPAEMQKTQRLTAKYHKFNPPADKSIYLDASLQPKSDLSDLIAQCGPLTVFDHPYRQDVYREALTVTQIKRNGWEGAMDQVLRYEKEGLPKFNGLCESGFLYRDLTDQRTKDYMNLWYRELLSGCGRDQIAWGYANWKMPGVCGRIKANVRQTKWFNYFQHK